MDIGQATLADVARLAVGALGGAAVGLEREWSGHATGADARLAGIRTFTLLGGLAATAGWLLTTAPVLGAVLLGAAALLVLAGYVAASRHHIEATTETAALVVLATGVLAGLGELALSSGIVAVTAVILNEKSRLHTWVSRLDDRTLTAALRFAVMATVILPLFPEGPVDPWGWVRPRPIWLLVLFFSGLSFVGYLARKAVGPEQGYAVAGLLGGFVSSTSVSLGYARLSRSQPEAADGLASGVVAASTVMFVRIAIAVLVLDAALMPRVAQLLAAPFAAGLVASLWSVWRQRGDAQPDAPDVGNPLQLWSALKLALLFQVVFILVPLVQGWIGDRGVLASAFVLGLSSVDAVTVSVARGALEDVGAATAAAAIAVGVLSNTLAKLVLVVALGVGRFRVLTAVGLGAIALAGAVTLVWLR